jgi:hypothetical protein
VDATLAALLGTAIGAGTAFISAVLTNAVTLRNERARQMEARHTTQMQALREHTAVVFAELFAVQHPVEWVAFFAKHDPPAIDRQVINWFDDEVRRAYPRMLGALTMVAALDLGIYDELRPLVDHLVDLEGRVTIALRRIETDRTAVEAVAAFLPASHELMKTLPRDLARIMEVVGSY